MNARPIRIDMLIERACYGLEIAALFGLACLALVAHDPDRPGAGLLLLAGALLLTVGAASLVALRGSRAAGALWRRTIGPLR